MLRGCRRHALSLSLLCCIAIAAHAGEWQKYHGPFAGSIAKVIVDPTDARVLYALSDRHIFKTVDAGASWRRIYESSTTIHVFDIAPGAPAVLYVDHHRSDDGGDTWQHIEAIPHFAIELGLAQRDRLNNEIAIHPQQPLTVVAAQAIGGIYVTQDGGKQWALAKAGMTGLAAFASESDTTLFLLREDRFYVSSNLAASWTQRAQLPIPPQHAPRKLIATADGVFALIVGEGDSLGAVKIFASTDGGRKWQQQPTGGLPAANDFTERENVFFVATDAGLYRAGATSDWLRISPDFDSITCVAVGDQVLIGSATHGISRATLQGQDWQNVGIAPVGGRETRLYSTDDGRILHASDNGLYLLNQDAKTWRTFVPTTKVVAPRVACAQPVNAPDKIFCAYGDSLFILEASDPFWSSLGALPDTAMRRLTVASDRESLILTTAKGTVFLSEDGGTTWMQQQSPPDTVFDLHWSNTGRVFALTAGGYFYSENDMATWQALQEGLPDETPVHREIMWDANDSDRIYALFPGTPNRLFEKAAGENRWRVLFPVDHVVFPAPSQKVLTRANAQQTLYALLESYFDGHRYLAKAEVQGGVWTPVQAIPDSFRIAEFGFLRTMPEELYVIEENGKIWHSSFPRAGSGAPQNTARVQFIHSASSQAAASFTISADSIPVVRDLEYRAATPFVDIPVDAVLSIVSAAGDTFLTEKMQMQAGSEFLGVVLSQQASQKAAGNSAAVRLAFFPHDTASAPDSHAVALRFLHSIPDVPAVHLRKNGANLFPQAVQFGEMSQVFYLAAGYGVAEIVLAPEDTQTVQSFRLRLEYSGGQKGVLLASGFFKSEQGSPQKQLALSLITEDGHEKTFTRVEDPPEPPGQVQLLQPGNGANAVSTSPVLRWRAVGFAATYAVQLDTSAQFEAPSAQHFKLADTLYTPGALKKSTRYFWRVRALNTSGAGPWSPTWQFVTRDFDTPPDAPHLLSPANGVEEVMPEVILHWTASRTASSYEAEIAENEDFSPALRYNALHDTILVLRDLDLDTQYFWRVRAVNDLGASAWSESRKFRTRKSNAPPERPTPAHPADGEVFVPVRPVVSWHPARAAIAYEVQIAADSGFAKLQFARQSVRDTTLLADSLEHQREYFWRVRAHNSVGHSPWSETRSFVTEPAYPSSIALDTVITFPQPRRSGEYNAVDYRIVGLPGGSGALFSEILEGRPGKDWQAYWDNGASENYLVPFQEKDSSIFRFEAGRAFWLLSHKPLTLKRIVASPPLDRSHCALIPLHRGWNLVTNPFAAAIEWEAVQEYNGIHEAVWEFQGQFQQAVLMKPFQGYYFFQSGVADTLRIPYRFVFMKRQRHAREAATFWRINISLEQGELLEELVSIGVSGEASKGLDVFDRRRPRNPGAQTGVLLLRPDWDPDYPLFASDIRRPVQGAAVWEFRIVATPGKVARLDFRGVDRVPRGYVVHLLNKLTGQIRDLRSDAQQLFSPQTEHTDFCLLVGLEDDVQQQEQSMAPGTYALWQNYPNPFNPETTIPVSITSRTTGSLRIYNAEGRQVRLLFNGRFNVGYTLFRWDGRDDDGMGVAAGLYFCRLSTSQGVRTRKLLLIH